MLVLVDSSKDVDSELAGVGRRSHSDSETIVVAELLLDKIQALKATEHVIYWH